MVNDNQLFELSPSEAGVLRAALDYAYDNGQAHPEVDALYDRLLEFEAAARA